MRSVARNYPVGVFGFLRANLAAFPIATIARVLGVSRAGYCAWAGRPASARARADAGLLERIRTIHVASHGTYGAPRIRAELQAGGEMRGRKRIARLMRRAGITGVSRRRCGPVTTRRDREARPAPELVDRDFSAPGPNRLWVTDITFIPTTAGFLYLAVVLDALETALGQRRSGDVILHSDQGSRFTSLAFGNRC